MKNENIDDVFTQYRGTLLGRAAPGAADDNEASGSAVEESKAKQGKRRRRRGAGRPGLSKHGFISSPFRPSC